MPTFLCITVRFLQPYSHGRGDGDDPQWPPSPLRLFQAMVAASAGHWNERARLATAASALNWLEAQAPPEIVAPHASFTRNPYRLYVPDNVADKVAAAWHRGREASIADYRAEKDVAPAHLSGNAVHYLYALPNGQCPCLDVLVAAARGMTHLGWGIDMVAGDARIVLAEQAETLSGGRWKPASTGDAPLRVPTNGTLDDLTRKHRAFLDRLSSDAFKPVPPLSVFRLQAYRRADEPLARPYRAFELRQADGGPFRYPPRRLIHIAGMVRHLAIEAMQQSPPAGLDSDWAEWVETYVAGHAAENGATHRQLSYLPLPSIGHPHTDPGVRRIMIVAPTGDDAWLDHLARHLAGQPLKPLRGDEFGDGGPPLLVPVRYDKVVPRYTEAADHWASVTPVILPGHDDHKPAKTRKLIERSLAQAGVEQSCEFEWSAFSQFPKSFSAHKYGRDGRPTGYIRPDHLLSQTAVHVTLRFKDGLRVPGPLAIGAGRHCGLGVFAAVE